jgi:cell division protein FtsL
MSKGKEVVRTILVCILALCIPALLVVDGMQAKKYTELQNEVADLEKKQSDLVDENKKLITDISMLSSSDRIETIAKNELNMRQAETNEIVRVEMKGSKK